MSAVFNKIQRRANGKYDARDVVQEARLHHKTKAQRQEEAMWRKSSPRLLERYDNTLTDAEKRVRFWAKSDNEGMKKFAQDRLEEAIERRTRAYREAGVELPKR